MVKRAVFGGGRLFLYDNAGCQPVQSPVSNPPMTTGPAIV